MRRNIIALVLGITFAGPAVFAQTSCINIHDADARLACYDRAAGYMPATGSEAVNAKASSTRESPTELGAIPEALTPAPQKLSSKIQKADRLGRVYPVTKMDKTNTGKALIFLADGQVWRQTDSKNMRIGKKTPDNITIKPAAMGSFFIKWDGQRAFRAKRVR